MDNSVRKADVANLLNTDLAHLHKKEVHGPTQYTIIWYFVKDCTPQKKCPKKESNVFHCIIDLEDLLMKTTTVFAEANMSAKGTLLPSSLKTRMLDATRKVSSSTVWEFNWTESPVDIFERIKGCELLVLCRRKM